jgi:hypothetical protein
MVLAVGCTDADPHNYIIVDGVAATAKITGGELTTFAYDAVVRGPVRVGSPFTVSGHVVDPDSWARLDLFAPVTGDQTFEAPETRVYVVDTRHVAPDYLLARCGATIGLQVSVSAEMADDGHLEGSTSELDAAVVCN